MEKRFQIVTDSSCDLPQAMNKLAEQADGINWELEEIRKTLPELKPRVDLTPGQK